MKALLPFYAGQVKCIFIDPPYNTKSAFTHYDDNLEHSVWLSMMYPRLEILRELLAEDGSIWITLDDNESHYLKIMLDEIFGRKNFVANVVWQHSIQGKNDSKLLSIHHNQLLVFRKSDSFRRNLLPRQEEHNINYKNPDNDPRGAWRSGDFRSPNLRENLRYDIVTPNGNTISPPEKGWRWSKDTFFEKVKTGEISFIENETKVLRKIYLSEQEGRIPETIWFGKEVGTTRDANNEIKNIFNSAFFETPKPELLIQRVLQIATSENDLVLDSFLGSGTTAAVAHKMNRRYIGIEIGEHAKTHVVPRLKKVIEGEQGGISKAVGWQGGGSFRFCELGEEVFDAFGSLNPNIRFDDLAAHIWYLENHFPLQKNTEKSPLVGTFNGKAYYLLYNGILGDKRPQSGNVLTRKLMAELPYFAEFIQQGMDIVVYGEACRLGEAQLAEKKITFKQIPYDVTAR
ncbi:DNA methylase N-4/N-6 domain protein [Mannheimia varigena USDA-ARS-USMARC-1388]|nr:DNA methylase N-4/N-6 domain protein [Mannheimia varigena USDA-ARS-USMARC-1388]